MPGQRYLYDVTDCTGGINQNAERILPNQCADALNVWAPSGGVEQRPGYRGVIPSSFTAVAAVASIQSVVFKLKDVSGGTFSTATYGNTLNVGGAVGEKDSDADGITDIEGDELYIGSALGPDDDLVGFGIITTALNAAAVRAELEYYNGTSWLPMGGGEFFPAASSGADVEVDKATITLSTGTTLVYFVAPADWTASTIDSVEKYWIRLRFVDEGGTSLTAGTTIDNGSGTDVTLYTGTDEVVGMFAVAFPRTRRYLLARAYNAAGTIVNASSLGGGVIFSYAENTPASIPIRAAVAVVPQSAEVFMSVGNDVYRLSAYPGLTDVLQATVEDRDFAIGSGAPWDKDSIAQRSGFPTAKFISFFHNRLWVIDEDEILVWSAAFPYHRVWPLLSYQQLMESDNSKTTGMKPIGDSMAIYKNDSIWTATFSGFGPFDEPQYAVRLMAPGVGCVANGTIQTIRGVHVFLSEQGVARFDGVRTDFPSEQQVQGTIIDRLRDIWPRITPGRRAFASSAHWRSKKTYLLGVSLDGSEANNYVIAWDYNNDTWWIWDNIEAQFWLVDEGADDEERLYFGDNSGRIFEFGLGDEDNGAAIDAHVVTRRMSYKDGSTETLREIEVTSRNTTSALDVQVSRAGTPFAHAETAKTLSLADRNETVYGDAMGSNFSWRMERTRSIYTRFTATHIQAKISTSRKGRPFYLSQLRAGFKRLGR